MKNLTRSSLLVVALLGLWWLYPQQSQEVGAAPDTSLLKRERLAITATGADGAAGGSDTTDNLITGRVIRVDIDYAAGITDTTDLTLTDSGSLATVNIVNKTDTITDGVVYPAVGLTDNTGTALTYDGTRPVVDYYPVAGRLTATITQTTAATPAVTIDIYYEGD